MESSYRIETKAGECRELVQIQNEIRSQNRQKTEQRKRQFSRQEDLRNRRDRLRSKQRQLGGESAVGLVGSLVPGAVGNVIGLMSGRAATELALVNSSIAEIEGDIPQAEAEIDRLNREIERLEHSQTRNAERMRLAGCATL